MKAKVLAAHALLAASALAGCHTSSSSSEKKPPAAVEYGAPVGIQFGGSGGLPVLLAAAAAPKSEPALDDAVVPDLATALYAAATHCPDLMTVVGNGDAVSVRFGVAGEVLKSGAEGDDPVGKCMAQAMDGKHVKGLHGSSVLIQVMAQQKKP